MVAVKVDEKTLSRIVTAPMDVQETTGLKPNIRTSESCENARNFRNFEQSFDAGGRALKTTRKYQKVYRKH